MQNKDLQIELTGKFSCHTALEKGYVAKRPYRWLRPFSFLKDLCFRFFLADSPLGSLERLFTAITTSGDLLDLAALGKEC